MQNCSERWVYGDSGCSLRSFDVDCAYSSLLPKDKEMLADGPHFPAQTLDGTVFENLDAEI